jgi:ABC-type transport system substrate-binding protein
LALSYSSYDDPDFLYLEMTGTGMFYKNATLTKYLLAGRETNNPRVVRRNYIAAQRFMNRMTVVDPLFTPLDLFGLNKRVHGWHVNFFTLGYTVEPVLQDLWVSK